ncbi:MAG: hypothetical protein ACLS3Y_04415 [Collinsella sp.]
MTPKSSSVTDQVKATKSLTGRDSRPASSTELVEGNDVVATGTNAADGKIAMSEIAYTEAALPTRCARSRRRRQRHHLRRQDLHHRDHHHRQGRLRAKHSQRDNEAKLSNSYKPNPDEFSVTDQIAPSPGRPRARPASSPSSSRGQRCRRHRHQRRRGQHHDERRKHTAAGKHTYSCARPTAEPQQGHHLQRC